MGSNAQTLVSSLKREGYIRSSLVEQAFLSVPREMFVPEEFRRHSYEDTALPIGWGQTISAPSMIAIMLERLSLGPGQAVLEIGTGSGYNACLLAHMAGAKNVVSVERIGKLYERARDIIQKGPYRDMKLVLSDGTLGYGPRAPYDRIIVTAAAPSFPASLVSQLKVGGRIAAPVGRIEGPQHLIIGTKLVDGTLERRVDIACIFVPLVGKEGFSPKDI